MFITFTEAEWKQAQAWKQTAELYRQISSLLYSEALRGFRTAMALEKRAEVVLG